MKSILMILDNTFPTDNRVEKEALSLTERGHTVHILCIAPDGEPLSEEYKGIHIIRFAYPKKWHNKLAAAYHVLPFHRMKWKAQIEKVVAQKNIDILHLHDLPLIDVALSIAKKYDIKVVSDQHETYPHWIKQTRHYNTTIGKIVSALSNWEAYQNKYLPQADLIITLNKGLEESYINSVGASIHDKIISVPNAPRSAVFDKSSWINNENFARLKEHYKDNFVLCYIGNIDILRGVDTVIKSLKHIEKEIPEVKYVLLGKHLRDWDPVEIAKREGVEHLVDYIGFLPIEEVPPYVAISDVCVHVPPAKGGNQVAIPTKMYQFVNMHKPIVTGQTKVMKRLVTENNIGLIIKDRDAEDLAEKIITLYKDKELREQMIRNCERIAPDLVWEKTIQTMLDRYEKL